jgi:hypothetical protein
MVSGTQPIRVHTVGFYILLCYKCGFLLVRGDVSIDIETPTAISLVLIPVRLVFEPSLSEMLIEIQFECMHL